MCALAHMELKKCISGRPLLSAATASNMQGFNRYSINVFSLRYRYWLEIVSSLRYVTLLKNVSGLVTVTLLYYIRKIPHKNTLFYSATYTKKQPLNAIFAINFLSF